LIVTPKNKIRVLCVEDHRIVRDGIALIINRQPDMHVVGLAATGEEAIDMFRRQRPDVTLMDLRLGAMSGVSAIRAIRTIDQAARIVVLTMYQGDEDIYRALEAGAATYLLKDTLTDELIGVIRDVKAGKQPPVSATVQARLDERSERPSLTPRELEILGLISQGMQNKEIAAALGISEATTQVHVKNILAKLDVRHRTAALNVAVRRGIVHLV
jgi:two-component system NarL family response regulator